MQRVQQYIHQGSLFSQSEHQELQNDKGSIKKKTSQGRKGSARAHSITPNADGGERACKETIYVMLFSRSL